MAAIRTGGPARRPGRGGRFRRFTRAEIEARGDNLDISWLRDTSGDPEDTLTEPEEFIAAIRAHLTSALGEIEALADELEADAPGESRRRRNQRGAGLLNSTLYG